MSVEYTDDPHPRNIYWEMWGLPMFDLAIDEADVVLREVRACREAHPDHYVKLIAYDATRGRQTTALSFIVERPAHEPGFRLDRTDAHDRVIRYRLLPGAGGGAQRTGRAQRRARRDRARADAGPRRPDRRARCATPTSRRCWTSSTAS